MLLMHPAAALALAVFSSGLLSLGLPLRVGHFLAAMAVTTSLLSSFCWSSLTWRVATVWGAWHSHRQAAIWASSFRLVSSVLARCTWMVGGSLMVKAAMKNAVPSSPGEQYSSVTDTAGQGGQ